MKRTDNYSTDFISQDYYSYLVELRKICNYILTLAEKETDPEIQDDFFWHLKLLVREMEPKYERRQDIDKPEELKKEVEELNLREGQSILSSVSTLQERLGITSMARNDYEMDPIGAVDAEGDRK